MVDHTRASILLCEQIYEDRGKLSLLGVGWDVATPGKRRIFAAATVDLRSLDQDVDIRIEFALRVAHDGEGKALAGASLQGQLNPLDDGVKPREFVQITVPIRWHVELRPNTLYEISAHFGDSEIGKTQFWTSEHAADEQARDVGTGDAEME